MAKRKAKSKLSFNIEQETGPDFAENVSIKKLPLPGTAPIFTRSKRVPALPSKPSLGPTLIANDVTVVPESDIYRAHDMAAHILANFTKLNIQNLINDSSPVGSVKLHLFRLYLYAIKNGQADEFFWYAPNSEFRALFTKLFSDIQTIIIDVSGSWEGTTFKDKFISKDSITPVRIDTASDKKVVKKVKINPIVLKRLGIPP